MHSGYLADKDREVSEMQEYYDLYLQATKLIAASYAIGGDLKTAEESFRIGEQFIGLSISAKSRVLKCTP